MPEIEIYIQNRDGSVNRRMFQYDGLQIEHPLNDTRTCRFNCPITDTNALNQSNVQHFLPLQRYVMAIYNNRPVFWGPIVKPVFNFKENRVEVNATDVSIYWKNHHLDPAEAEDPLDYAVNGLGLESLVTRAEPTAAEYADGAVDTGINFAGNDIENYLIGAESERRTHRLRPGQSIFDGVQELSEPLDGPDWDILPINEAYDPFTETPGPGYYAMLRARERIGQDKSLDVIFHYGWGRTNLDNFIYEPDGDTIRNRAVVANSRGKYKVAKYIPGYAKHGIMEEWEDSNVPRLDYAAFKAKRIVSAYGEPLQTFTIEPTWDQGLMGSAASTPFRYPSGYSVGDTIRAIAKLDRMVVDSVGRVIKVTLTQLNAAENVQSQVECIPESVDIEEDVTVGDDIQ